MRKKGKEKSKKKRRELGIYRVGKAVGGGRIGAADQ